MNGLEELETAAAPVRRARRTALIVVAAAVVALLVLALIDPSFFTTFDAEALAERVRASGWRGPLILIVLLIAQSVIAPLPSPPILIATGYVYDPWIGFAIGWIGLLLGAVGCFVVAGALGRPFVERFVKREHLATVEDYVTRRTGATLLAIVSLRVFMPPLFDAVSYGCGIVRVPFRWFLLGTALGEIPKVASFVYIGAAAGGVSNWLTAWVFLGPAIGVLVLRLIAKRNKKAGGDSR